MKWSRDYLLAALLAGLALGLGVIVTVEWLVLEQGREAMLDLPPAKPARTADAGAGEAKDFELPGLDDYEQMTERPLFMESRRPGAEGGPPPPPPVAQTPLTSKLMGIVWTPQGKKALIVDAKGKYKRMKPLDILDNWTLIELGVDRVVMQQGEERKELPLLKKKPKPPPGPGQPGQPGQMPGQQPPRAPHPQAVPPPEEIEDEGTEIPEEDPETEMPVEEDAAGNE